MEVILFLQEQQDPTPSHDERKMAGVLPPNFRLSSRLRKTPRDPYSSFVQLSDQTSDQTPAVSSPNSSFYFQSPPLLNNTLPRSVSLPTWTFLTVEQEENEHNHTTTNTTTDQDWPGCISNNSHDNLQQKNKTYYEPADFGPVFEEDTGRTTKAASKKSNIPHQQQKSGDGHPPPKKSDKKTPKCNNNNNNNNNLRRSYSNPGQGKSGMRRIPVACKGQECVGEDEKWAGPAYSKSPPPCSLPFPKFSVHQPATTRSLSADMTSSDCDPLSSSSVGGRDAASSVTHQQSVSQQVSSCNCWDAAFATEDLKRILNLDQQVAT